MRDIADLSKALLLFGNKVKANLVEAQQNTAKKIWEDVVDNAPVRSGTYISSIQVGDTKISSENIKTRIYTDLLVGGEDPKWSKVPLGAFLEWGTGIKGAGSNTYPHGYGYRLTPWCYYDKYLNMYITTDGIIARPHFLPALISNKQYYLEQIRKAVREAWMK